jgi:hypothetical protein
MAGKREKPEDIVLKLRQVEVLQGQGRCHHRPLRHIGASDTGPSPLASLTWGTRMPDNRFSVFFAPAGTQLDGIWHPSSNYVTCNIGRDKTATPRRLLNPPEMPCASSIGQF